jgi:tetratricopeptide (TPR) repeat protein
VAESIHPLAEAKSLHRSGRLQEAERLYREIVDADPQHHEALYFLAVACDALDKPSEAIEFLERLVATRPDHPEARNLLGALLAGHGRVEQAIPHFAAACRLKPEWNVPKDNLQSAQAESHNQQGLSLAAQGKLDLAAAAHRAALAIRPDDPAAHGNLGNILQRQGRLDEAAASYRRMLAVAPRVAEAHFGLGLVAREQSQLAEARQCFHRALELKPDFAQAHCELGRLALEAGQPHDALAHYRRGVELAPHSADAHLHLAYALLLTGQLAEGWREYEWRLAIPAIESRPPVEPRWQGEPLAAGTILLRCEQGYGDALMAIRYARFVRQRVREVMVECRQPLAGLLAHAAGVEGIIVRGQPRPRFDVHASLLSLPGIFGTTLDTIPAQVPYLDCDPALAAHWRAELSCSPAFKIGIAWQGNPDYDNDRARSIPLAEFAPLSRLSGVRLYSLQLGPGREQLAQFADRWPIVDLADRIGDFHDTAAIMRNLDLVISADSAPAHLAGALGVPAWIALAHAADWRWLVGRSDSPWYPTLRLFRQTSRGDWPSAFAPIASELARLVAESRLEGDNQ